MPWKKGQSGNPRGRLPNTDSLSELIRESATPERRQQMMQRMWALAAESHSDAHVRVKACEWLAKHGWPDESSGRTTVTMTPGEDGTSQLTVVHEHHKA